MPTIDLGKVVPSINGKEAVNGNVDLTHTDVDAVAQPETENDSFTDGSLSPWVNYKEELSSLKDHKADAIVCEASGGVISLDDASDLSLHGLRIFGKTTQDGTPTPDAPVELMSVGDDGSVGVGVRGKNLLSDEEIIFYTVTDRYKALLRTKKRMILRPGTYTLSFDTEDTGILVYVNWQFAGFEKQFVMDGSRISNTFTIDEARIVEANTAIVSRESETSDVPSGYISNVQLENGGNATSYEPCAEQVLTLSTPNGQPGIPVTSGGNYTDENGQQWVCDEIDLERGVYVQRIRKRIVDGKNTTATYYGNSIGPEANLILHWIDASDGKESVAYSNHLMCDSYAAVHGDTMRNDFEIRPQSRGTRIYFSDSRATNTSEINAILAANPITIMYELAVPVETSLSDAEIAAYKLMHTNKPNTTIYNDAGAWQIVEYTADTKRYIDKKFDALAAALLS